MKFSQSSLLGSTEEEAAEILYREGLNLSGKPLRRASWQQIAHAILNSQRYSSILLTRLKAAKTREDALRVLRLARKIAVKKQKGGGAKKTPKRQPQNKIIQDYKAQKEEQKWQLYLQELKDSRESLYAMEEPYPPTREDFLAWKSLLEMTPADYLSPVQEEALKAFYLSPKQKNKLTLRSILDEERIRSLGTYGKPTGRPTNREEKILVDRQLLRSFLEKLQRAEGIGDGYALAGVAVAARYGISAGTLDFKWHEIAHWYRERFCRPAGDQLKWVVIGFCYFLQHASAESLCWLLEHFCNDEQLDEEWLPLLPFFYCRMGEIGFEPISAVVRDRFSWQWEQVMVEIAGSKLPLVLMRNNLRDWRNMDFSDLAYCGLPSLLLKGGGTLRRQNYPEFTLVARPAISLVDEDVLGDMHRLLWFLYCMARGLQTRPTEAVSQLLEDALKQTGVVFPALENILKTLQHHAIGYILLKEEQNFDENHRLRRKHIRQFWKRLEDGRLEISHIPGSFEEVVEGYGTDRLIEGLVHALLGHLNQAWPSDSGEKILLKEPFIVALRTLTLNYRSGLSITLPPQIRKDQPDAIREAADLLLRQSRNAALELAQSLNLAHPLPLLNSGKLTEWEHRCHQVLKRAASGDLCMDDSQPPRIFTCRPLGKRAALERGKLGGCCGAVPLRATSPHHIYYGIWENGRQQRGFMTVFECWAENTDGRKFPALCLETINVPIDVFDAVQQDLLLIFDAIARSRGLHSPIAMTTGLGTWNYRNQFLLARSRRFRQGQPVILSPADPVQWYIYWTETVETSYCSFCMPIDDEKKIRILAPFDPERDKVQPENLAEAQRLAGLTPKKLITTTPPQGSQPGFISSWPEVPDISIEK